MKNICAKQKAKGLGGFLAKIFGFGRKSKTVIEQKINIGEETISVVARVSVQQYKYLTDGDPFLKAQAQNLIDQGRIGDFIKKYGPTYVESQILGGDVYYVYNYSFGEMSREKRTSFENNISVNVKNIFGIETDRVLTNKEKEEISNSVEKYFVESNIIGFTPTFINNVSQLNAEVNRIQNYLAANPVNAAAMEMELSSYANIYDLQEFKDLFDKELKCYSDWEEWVVLYDKINYIANNASRQLIIDKAQIALGKIQNQINNSLSCNGSRRPTKTEYQGIIKSFNAEVMRKKVQEARVNVFLGRGDRFSWFNYKVNGQMTAVYRWVYIQSGKVSYGKTKPKPENFTKELAGYVFKIQKEGTLPLYSYYYTNNRDIDYLTYVAQPTERHHLIGYVFPPKEE